MKLIQISIMICLGSPLFSQQYDNNYIISVLDYNFVELPVKIEYDKTLDSLRFIDINLGMSLLGYNIHMNDSLGNLIFYTNGLKIFNKNHQLIENGDSLNFHGEYSDSLLYESAIRSGHYFPAEGMMNPLPVPGHENEYMFFHTTIFNGEFDRMRLALRFSRIDLNLNSNTGAVIEKNVLVDTNVYVPQVTKHANGVDWWVCCVNQENVDSINYFVYLLDENGLSGPAIYEGGSPHDPLEETQFYYNHHYKAAFSPDGKHLAILRKFNLDLFKFNRCTGELSFVQNWSLLDPSLEPSIEQKERGVYSSVIFSEDSEKIILKNVQTYLVIDFKSEQAYPILISGIYPTLNSTVRLPDGNIFTYSSLALAETTYYPFAGLILDSDLPASNFRYNFTLFDSYQYNSPFISYGSLPILPNYRLDAMGEIDLVECKEFWYHKELEDPEEFDYKGKTYSKLLRKFKY